MKPIDLALAIGDIDDGLVEQAISAGPRIRLRAWRRGAIAACLVLALCAGILLPLLLRSSEPAVSDPVSPPLTHTVYADVADIPVKRIGSVYGSGSPGGPVELFALDGKLYFSFSTRMEGNDKTQTTVLSYTLFQYQPADGSCIAVSDEVGYIFQVGGQFLYDRSHAYLTADNRWTVPYYLNDVSWRQERKISGEQAKRLMDKQAFTAVIDGVSVAYTTAVQDNTAILITVEGRGTYEVTPRISSVVSDAQSPAINRIIGIADKALYFTADYQLGDLVRTDLFRVGLDGKGLKMVSDGRSGNGVGADTRIGEDGCVYYHYAGSVSTFYRYDPLTGACEQIASADAYVWQWITDGTVILALTAGNTPADPSGLLAVRYE